MLSSVSATLDAPAPLPSGEIPAALLSLGPVRIVDVSAIKTATGQLWEAVAEGTMLRFEKLLGSALSTSASFHRMDEMRYVLSLPGNGEEEATITAVFALYQFFMSHYGRCEFDWLRVSRVLRDAQGTTLNAAIGPQTIAEIQQKADLKDLIVPRQYHVKQMPVVSNARIVRDRPVREAARPAPRRVSGSLNVQHQFEPVWNAQHEVITTYICAAKSIEIAAEPGKTVTLDELELNTRIEAEFSSLRVGLRYLSGYIATGDRFLLGVPISFETLSSPLGRTRMASICRGLPALYRQYLVFYVTDMPLGVAQSRVSEFVSVLRPFGKVVASVASGCRNFSAYQGLGLFAIALDLRAEWALTDKMKSDIVYTGAAGRYSKLTTMLYGVNDAAVLPLGQAADIQLFHGLAVMAARQVPRRMSHVPVDMVMPADGGAGSEDWF